MTNDLPQSAISNTVSQVGHYLQILEQLGPLVLLLVFLVAIGYAIKTTQIVKSRHIPLIVICMGGLLNFFLYPTQALVPRWEYPYVVKCIYGVIVGVGAWMLHRCLLSRVENWLEKKNKLPVTLMSQEGQTAFYTKQKEKEQ